MTHDHQSSPSESGIQPFAPDEVQKHLLKVPGWEADDDATSIHRGYEFSDFETAMAFVNAVAKVAEELHHHPDIHIFFRMVFLECTTHAATGLTEKDFLLASNIDKLPESKKASAAEPHPYLA